MQTLKQLACFLLDDETGPKVDMCNRKEDKVIDVRLICLKVCNLQLWERWSLNLVFLLKRMRLQLMTYSIA